MKVFAIFLLGFICLVSGLCQKKVLLHPGFFLTLEGLEELLQDQPPDIREKILSSPKQFLTDYKPLLSADWGQLVLVDKEHELPYDYEPRDLVKVRSYPLYCRRNDLMLRQLVIPDLLELDRSARKSGLKILISSAYRSWEYQKNLFQRYVQKDGLATADKYSARAGHSQHQLGTVIDIGSVSPEVAQTKEGRWMFDHAWQYGFSLSFPEGYTELTGYVYEPWHYRYLGKEACYVQRTWFENIQHRLLLFHHVHGKALIQALRNKE